MYTNEQMERIKRYNREMEDAVFNIWLRQYDDDHNYYTKEEEDRYDRE